MPASAKMREFAYRIRIAKQMRSSGLVRRRKIQRRREENWFTRVGFEAQGERSRETPMITQTASALATAVQELHCCAVAFLNPAVIPAVREINHQADG